MSLKIRHEIDICIGCSACTSECPENWEMVELEDGYKAKPKKIKLEARDIERNKKAEEVCPVNCIHIEKE